MTASVDKSSRLPPVAPKICQVAMLTEKQDIVTVLGSDMERARATSASIRRTVSADMSSKEWLAQNGFSPMNKTASSKELYSSDALSSSEGEENSCEERRGQFDIQRHKHERDEMMQVEEKQGQSDIWSSIIFHKTNDDASKSRLPLYVHPLVKRSNSCLSERSLEICTESLGSETGSDGFSSYPSSENGDAEDQDREEHQEEQESESVIVHSYDAVEEEFKSVTKYNYAAATKKVTARTYPPPLPSLSRSDGASLRMRSVRDNGRLVVEAVSIPSQKNLHAERQDGRLVLTFLDDCKGEEPEVDDGDEQEVECESKTDDMDGKEEEFEGSESVHKEKEQEEYEDDGAEEELDVEEVETKDIEIVIEDAQKLFSDSMTNVHKLAFMIKSYELGNRNPSWSRKFNEVVKVKKAEEVDMTKKTTTPVAQLLPPRPMTNRTIPSSTAVRSAAGSFNTYEHYWRPKQTAKATQNFDHQEFSLPLWNNYYYKDTSITTKNVQMQNERQQVLVLRGKKGNYLIPMSKTCKKSRGSALFWEPYCIATS